MNDKLKVKIKNVFGSKIFRHIIFIFGILVIVSIIFQAGMMAGFRKASFGCDWGNNYDMNFGSPHKIPKMIGINFGDFGNLPNANGAIGKIIKIELPTIIVLDDKDNTEKVILISKNTEIRKMRDSIKVEDLKIDEHIVVIGEPNSSGQIEAKLIRFLPAPLPLPEPIN